VTGYSKIYLLLNPNGLKHFPLSGSRLTQTCSDFKKIILYPQCACVFTIQITRQKFRFMSTARLPESKYFQSFLPFVSYIVIFLTVYDGPV
jgi:hypothetical protein